MIVDSLTNLSKYSSINPGFGAAAVYLRTHAVVELSCGRYPADPNGAYAIVDEYETRPIDECFFECHRQFIDIHIAYFPRIRGRGFFDFPGINLKLLA
jgi:YhcH/YjgK/YiaL family protein